MGLSDSDARGVHVGEPMQPTEAPPPGTFENFFRAERARLSRALYLATGNSRESDELAQDAFLKVWDRWDRVREMEDPRSYLYRVAMNTFRSRLRRATRAARRAFDRPPGLLDNVAERIPVPGDALERLGRRRHARNRSRRITAALLALAITIAGGARAWMTFGSAQIQRPTTPIVATPTSGSPRRATNGRATPESSRS